MEDALVRMQTEWMQMPQLKLTRRQAQRLWSLSTDVCEAAFATLVTRGFLGQTPDGVYGRHVFIRPRSSHGWQSG
jgi:hypothetical protein